MVCGCGLEGGDGTMSGCTADRALTPEECEEEDHKFCIQVGRLEFYTSPHYPCGKEVVPGETVCAEHIGKG